MVAMPREARARAWLWLQGSAPTRGEPPLLFPEPKFFTVKVAFTPADLDAAKKAMSCHRSQFSQEMLARMLPEQERIWTGSVAFIPAVAGRAGDDLLA